MDVYAWRVRYSHRFPEHRTTRIIAAPDIQTAISIAEAERGAQQVITSVERLTYEKIIFE
jgi:hypothetical protein